MTEQEMNIIISMERLSWPYDKKDTYDESLWCAPYFSDPGCCVFRNADLMAKLELLRKIGRINFTKFLQVIYSSKKFVKEYSFGDLKNILLYEKWNILQKKTAYMVLQKSKTKTNNYLPTEIIELIVGYLEVDDINYKVWIDKTEAYQRYENAKMSYEDYNSMTLNFMRNIIEKYGDPNKDSITNKIILSKKGYWKKVKAPEIKDMLKEFKDIPAPILEEMKFPGFSFFYNKGEMIERLTKYIRKTISPQDFKSYYTKENIKFYNYHKKEAEKNLTTIFSTTYWSRKPVKELKIIIKKQNWKGKTTNKQQTMQTIIRNLKKMK